MEPEEVKINREIDPRRIGSRADKKEDDPINDALQSFVNYLETQSELDEVEKAERIKQFKKENGLR